MQRLRDRVGQHPGAPAAKPVLHVGGGAQRHRGDLVVAVEALLAPVPEAVGAEPAGGGRLRHAAAQVEKQRVRNEGDQRPGLAKLVHTGLVAVVGIDADGRRIHGVGLDMCGVAADHHRWGDQGEHVRTPGAVDTVGVVGQPQVGADRCRHLPVAPDGAGRRVRQIGFQRAAEVAQPNGVQSRRGQGAAAGQLGASRPRPV